MRLRSLSVALLAGVVIVPVSASAATASTSTSPGVSAVSNSFKSSAAKRAKRVARTSAPVVTAPTAPTVPTTPTTTGSIHTGPTSAASYADRVLALTNTQRANHGLRALSFSSCADGFANSWAGALARAGSLSHQSLTPILTTCRARGVGENVAYGNVSPETLVQMWMDSPGHRANILNASFTHLGVGDVTTSTGRVYGVQVFLSL